VSKQASKQAGRQAGRQEAAAQYLALQVRLVSGFLLLEKFDEVGVEARIDDVEERVEQIEALADVVAVHLHRGIHLLELRVRDHSLAVRAAQNVAVAIDLEHRSADLVEEHATARSHPNQ